jgi:hypothetical protein
MLYFTTKEPFKGDSPMNVEIKRNRFGRNDGKQAKVATHQAANSTRTLQASNVRLT